MNTMNEAQRVRTFKAARKSRTRGAMRRIRELWPIIRLLRLEGLSWRELPAYMHMFYGVPRVSHVTYILIGRETGDVVYRPRSQ